MFRNFSNYPETKQGSNVLKMKIYNFWWRNDKDIEFLYIRCVLMTLCEFWIKSEQCAGSGSLINNHILYLHVIHILHLYFISTCYIHMLHHIVYRYMKSCYIQLLYPYVIFSCYIHLLYRHIKSHMHSSY